MALYDYKGNDLTKKLITGKMSYEDWEKLITRQMEEAIYKEIKAVQNNTFEVYKTTNVPSKYHFDKKNDRYNRIGDIILIAHF